MPAPRRAPSRPRPLRARLGSRLLRAPVAGGTRTTPSVRDKTSYASAVTETSAVVPLPSGWAVGDAHYIFCQLTASTGAITTPAGYAAIVPQFDSENSTSAESACFRKVETLQTGDSGPTITFSSGRFAAASLAVKDVDTSTFEDTAGGADNGPAATTTSVDAPSLTPNLANSLLLTAHTGRNPTVGQAVTYTAPTGMTEEVDVSSAVAAVSNASVEVCSLAVLDTNPTGLKTATASALVSASGMAVLVRGVVSSGDQAKTLTDTGTGTDALQVAVDAPLADTGSAADAVSVAAAVTLPDSGTASDAIAVTLAITFTDTAAATDSLQVAAAATLAEGGTGADSLQAAAAVTLTDAGSAADAIQVAVPKTLSDAGAGTDALGVTAAVPLGEQGTAGEVLSVAAAVTLTDVGSAADAISVVSAEPKTLTDAGSAADGLTVTAAVPLAEAGSAADTLALQQTHPLADAGTAADAVLVDQVRNLAEAGTGVDALRVTVAATLTDLGAGAENAAAAVLVALADVGASVDGIDVQTVVPVFWAVGVATTQPAATGTGTIQPQATGEATLQLASVGEGSQR